MSENDTRPGRRVGQSDGASRAAARRRAAVQEALARAHGPDPATSPRRASRGDVPIGGRRGKQGSAESRPQPPCERRGPSDERRKPPRCCRNCVYANPLQHGCETLQICVNTPEARGFFAIVDPCAVCPRFREPLAEVIRGIPPKCVDKGTRHIPLTKGQFAIVDAADFERLSQYRWHTVSTGGRTYYAGRKEHGRSIRMHREIMRPPKGMVVHHINGNGLDNRRINLCICTQADNIRSIGPQAGSSRYKGVWFDRRNHKWVAGITVGHKTINLGRFDREEEAARARDRKAFELWGKFAYLNFPEDFAPQAGKARRKERKKARR